MSLTLGCADGGLVGLVGFPVDVPELVSVDTGSVIKVSIITEPVLIPTIFTLE